MIQFPWWNYRTWAVFLGRHADARLLPTRVYVRCFKLDVYSCERGAFIVWSVPRNITSRALCGLKTNLQNVWRHCLDWTSRRGNGVGWVAVKKEAGTNAAKHGVKSGGGERPNFLFDLSPSCPSTTHKARVGKTNISGLAVVDANPGVSPFISKLEVKRSLIHSQLQPQWLAHLPLGRSGRTPCTGYAAAQGAICRGWRCGWQDRSVRSRLRRRGGWNRVGLDPGDRNEYVAR